MKSCIACNAEIEEEYNFCKICGSNQNVQPNNLIKSDTTFLTILCVLTIIGSLFGIARGWLYELVSTVGNDGYFRGWIYILANIGTLIGAIMILKNKRSGLHLYTVSQTVYIITVIYATTIYESSDFGGFAFLVSMLFLVPSIVFLILYWQKTITKHLNE
jgi:glucose dehydrogenase